MVRRARNEAPNDRLLVCGAADTDLRAAVSSSLPESPTTQSICGSRDASVRLVVGLSVLVGLSLVNARARVPKALAVEPGLDHAEGVVSESGGSKTGARLALINAFTDTSVGVRNMLGISMTLPVAMLRSMGLAPT